MNHDTLVKRRNAIRSQIAKIKTTVNKHDTDPLDLDQATLLIKKLNKLCDEADENHYSIVETCKDDDTMKLILDGHEKAEESAMEVESKLMKIQRHLQKNVVATGTSGESIPKSNNVKLPPIQIPTFEGDYLNWSSFQDLFSATIIKNQSLTGAQRLHYLKTSLKGEAAGLIKSLQVTDDNFDEAWKIILDRYENKREIVYSHLRNLFNQAFITKESAVSLQKLIDNTNESIRALTVLGRPVTHWDDLLVHLVVERLDQETRRQWAMTLKSTNLPTFDELSKFIEIHIRGLNAASSNKQPASSKSSGAVERKQTSSHHVSSKSNCEVCSHDHPLFRCPVFLAATTEEKNLLVKKHSLCFNCLRGGHSVNKCTSTHSCKRCDKRHNSLLHNEKQQQSTEDNSSTTPSVAVLFCNEGRSAPGVLLSTAVVHVIDRSGEKQSCRVLLDSASEASFISENLVQKLGLIRKRANVTVTGLSTASVGRARGSLSIEMISRIHKTSIKLEVLILPKVTGLLPSFQFKPSPWPHLDGLELADPNYSEPGNVDVLIGADVYAEIMREGLRPGPRGSPVALNTIFGWVLSGRVKTDQQSTVVSVHHAQCELTNIMQKFWEVEEGPSINRLTPEESKCEEHFQDSYKRGVDGRFIVELPFKKDPSTLGESRQIALKRFQQVERRMSSNPELKKAYLEFMKEYEELGHMQVVSPSEMELPTELTYYLPHHAVLKANKFRVVFDGSSKTSSGQSLNDCLMVGPKLQDDIFPLLIRFRTHIIGLTADICKMYRQFTVSPAHTNYQRVLWRESPDQPVRDYKLMTVTYGTASAPYLATKCLQQLAHDEQESFPVAAPVFLRDFYVDDFIGGEANQTQALALQQELNGLGRQANLVLCKYQSNDQALLQSLPPELRANEPLTIDVDSSVKALGLKWNPTEDYFSFVHNKPSVNPQCTKRTILSELAKVFDPLGWLSPATLEAKLMIQQLWKLTIGWDETLPGEIQESWNRYQDDLYQIQEIRIPRCIVTTTSQELQLHGFCDASEKAYSATVYMRSQQQNGTYMARLVAAKTRVAPIKQLSIPKLELCGAVLTTKLIKVVQKSMLLECELFMWTDSTIVLDWLAAFPNKWKTFVANRVAEIQDAIPIEQWHHVVSEENPADCASRGISPAELKDFELWWNGPKWLSSDTLPLHSEYAKQSIPLEERQTVRKVHQVCVELSLLEKFSSLSKLKIVTAYCMRFLFNIRTKKDNRKHGNLSQNELQDALLHWVKYVQEREFRAEINSLKRNHELSGKSLVRNLSPFVDSRGILRVGGRLHHSSLPEEHKHQIILPSQNQLSKLIIQFVHETNLHAGQQLLLSTLQREFWILRGKNAVRQFIRKCVVCRRHSSELTQQLMGSLPSARVQPSRPFTHCGVDYAGPFNLLVSRGRGRKSYKGYISLFVCFSTKAIHLEAVSDLTTDGFIASFRRFVSRRGRPADMYSDCGTNFVGADKELQALLQSNAHNNKVFHELSDSAINWHFNPPAAPHHGGLWEAGVKSVKFHLRRIVGNQCLTFEEFQTILTQVEACLNSRPLCALTSDPNDFNVLTPGHFLIGQPLNSAPDSDYSLVKTNRLSKWQHLQQMYQHFWQRWSNEYLSSLHQRFKWTAKRANLQVNDIVIIKEETLPPGKWKMGRVVELHPGSDNLVRVVTVKTATGLFKRPIVKLCPLLTDNCE